MAWTAQQEVAIKQRNADILVSAAAGSGKTAVLTERVMKRIIGSDSQQPIEIDRFLIVTFTSASAGEMKERILGKLSDYMNELQINLIETKTEKETLNLEDKIQYIERQMALVPKASISTIHSFCLKTIKAYFNKLDIDPNVKVGTQAELEVMKKEILEELLETYLEEGDADFLELAEVYGDMRGIEPLKELILEISTFSKSTAFPKLWLKEQVDNLSADYKDIDSMPWSNNIRSYFIETLEGVKVIYDKATTLCNKPNGPELYLTTLEQDMVQVSTFNKDMSLREIIDIIDKTSFSRISTKKQECDEGLKEKVKAYRDLGKEIIKELQDTVGFLKTEELKNHLPILGKLMSTLVGLIQEFEDKYQDKKYAEGIIDYNDLEHLCLELLVEPQINSEGKVESVSYTDVARELSDYYKEVYIDEYQDSNAVQEMILGAVAKAKGEDGPTRFMVGDMKQSIYRFRLANPLIFKEKYENWEKHGITKQPNTSEVSIDLSENFRSRENILNSVNDIFNQIMSKDVGELVYDDAARLKVGNKYDEGDITAIGEENISGAVEVHILETKSEEEEVNSNSSETKETIESLKNIECEALMVASLIDKLLKGEGNPTHVYDKSIGDYRKVEPRDIVILLRAHTEKAPIFEKALMQKGIGAYAEVSSNFFEAMEVQTVFSLLQIIDNPLQDIPLLTVLRSAIVGVSFDDLVEIRKSKDTGCFYEALEAYLEGSIINPLIYDFKVLLDKYRDISSQLSVQELLARIYVETGYYNYVALLPTGVRKKANLDLLKKYAASYENTQNGKLFGFILYLKQLEETKNGLPEAKIIGDNENLVQIMSIHKSKGLEFAVVFLCDTGKKFNQNDLMKPILVHQDLGLGPEYIDTKNYVKYPSIPKISMKYQITNENKSEEMRVLYVALTRAKEKLFITGTLSDIEKSAKRWSVYASREEDAILPIGVKRAGSYLNWIGLSLFAHSETETIRDLIGEKVQHCFSGEGKWKVNIWQKDMLGELKDEQLENLEKYRNILEDWDSQKNYGTYKEEVFERLNYEYAYKQEINLPTKVSVSEIKRESQKHNNEEYYTSDMKIEAINTEPELPSFMQEQKTLKATERGTLIHSVFEHLDYVTFTTLDQIKNEVNRLVQTGRIDKKALEILDYNKLYEMANSDVINQMRTADIVKKEQAFSYLLKAKEVREEYEGEEEVLIQGVIDSFFIDDSGITIIDYKTDYVDKADITLGIQKIKDRYAKQLELYSMALEGITGKKVVNKYIYLYGISRWIRLE